MTSKNPVISLAAARVNARLTQKEMAKKLGVDPGTVCNWEKGKGEPSLGQVRVISRLSGIPMDYIYVPEESNEMGLESERSELIDSV